MAYRQVFLFIFLLIAFCVYSLNVSSQSTLAKVKFSRIDITAGLSNSHINCITQDSKGFLWVGTADGLNKYDGYNFTVYRTIQNDTTGFYNNTINAVFEDRYGKIWVSTSNRGFYYYDLSKDKFIAIPSLSINCEIRTITEDQNKTLWITGISNRQAFAASLNRETNTWEHQYKFSHNNFVIGIIQDSADEYFLAIMNSGLFKWNKKTNELKEVQEEGLNKYFHKIIQDESNTIWIATRNGLSKYIPKTNTFKHYRSNPNHPENSFLVNVIRDVTSDENTVWVASENGGVTRLETQTETFTHFTSDKNDPNSISDNSIWSIYKDHQKRIWIGTFSSGLCVYDKMKYKFGELNVPLQNDIVNAIWKDKKNRIWVGTEGGLTMQNGNKVQHYTHQRERKGTLPNNPVLSIFEDSKSRMWFGTWDGGASRYDEQRNTFINYLPESNNPSSLSNGNVYNIKEESTTHHILVSSYDGLNILVDERLGKFERHLEKIHEANNYLRTIFEDSRGTLWLGSITALNRLDIKKEKWSNYLLDTISGSGTFVNCITENSDGTVWVGSNKGLHQIENNNIVKTYTTLDGLPNDIVNGILIDDHNFLWLSTTNGISKLNTKTKTFTNYDINDGLLSNEFKPNAYFKSNDGQLFFGGKGVNVFYPDSIKDNPIIPGVYLTGLKIFNRSVHIKGADSILHQSFSETDEITLRPEYNYFTIEYVGLNLTTSNKNQYAYKLEGFDNDWIYVGTQRFATYTNLDAGSYTFRVKAANNDGLWNEVGASIVIHVLPPWWKTWWFKSFVMLGLFFSALVISFVRTRSMRKTNRILEERVNQKTEQIQIQNKILTEQGEELAAQNEELIQSQEEIASQRDLVSQQNEILNERQEIIEKQNENLENEVAKRTNELVEYNQQLEQFAFISAHNLRAPVARILGLGQILNLAKNNPDEKDIIYPKLIHTAQELDSVVKDLNTILELKKNNDTFVTDVALASVIEMILQNLEKEITIAQARITTDFKQVSNLQTVKPYIDSILYNLISNAIKYRHPDRSPVIHIKTERLENEICLSVSDNGLGIDVDLFRDKLFTLYKRFHLHVEGKGMGLYLAKTQITSLGGRIEIDSEVNTGTTFSVYFKNH